MNKTDQRRLLAELNGEHVENTCIPDIVVSPEEVIHHTDLTVRSLYQQTVNFNSNLNNQTSFFR